jgi:hypothetical protein
VKFPLFMSWVNSAFGLPEEPGYYKVKVGTSMYHAFEMTNKFYFNPDNDPKWDIILPVPGTKVVCWQRVKIIKLRFKPIKNG